MKILLVSTQDYLHHPIPSRHHYIFEELARRHEVHVPHFHVSQGAERKTRLVVHEATRFTGGSPLIHYTLNAPTHFRVLGKIVRECGIEVVVASHVFAGVAAIRAARRQDIPVLFDLKDWFPDSAAAYYRNRVSRRIIHDAVWFVTRYNLDRSDRITTVSPSLVAKLRSFGYEATLVTNGVDTDRFVPLDGGEMRRQLGIGPGEFVLGFEGSVERWYALDRVIAALPGLLRHRPDTRLLIVGGSLFTGYIDELKAQAEGLGVLDRIIFTGPVRYHDLPRYIAPMDLGLIPLSPPRWVDIALPNKFFEYSACGKPILSSPIPDIMAIGGPHLSIYRNEAEFAEKVKEAMDHPRIFRPDVRSFSWRRKAEEFEEILGGLVRS
ncbi:MAG TPA: glycosyltransferase family 4 protein [Methanomicrobiales archaeon]|jgi:glycosyltransferase involved in cell wall biosynthesis|nr:glycosyltransferase family 4 protein [Methanomicrobiales archaeon]